MRDNRSIVDKEREKAAMTLPEMILWLQENPARFTPFFERWLQLCIEHEQQVYPVKPDERTGPCKGRRIEYGKEGKKHVLELLESAARFRKPGIWFAKCV